MADITFGEIVALIDHLTPQQQVDLTAYLLQRARERQLSVSEKMKLLRAAQIDVAVNQEPALRREDWYGDDGR
jgi:hypothetical protein